MKRVSNLLVAFMATIIMVSCAEKKSLDVLGGKWSVVSVGDLLVPDSVDAFIAYDLVEGVLYGSTGCNMLTFVTPDNMDGDTPIFALMGGTQRMCRDMNVEKAMLPALGLVTDFKVAGDSLYLLDASGVTVVSLVRQ